MGFLGLPALDARRAARFSCYVFAGGGGSHFPQLLVVSRLVYRALFRSSSAGSAVFDVGYVGKLAAPPPDDTNARCNEEVGQGFKRRFGGDLPERRVGLRSGGCEWNPKLDSMSEATRKTSEGKIMTGEDAAIALECAYRLRVIGDALNLRYQLMDILVRRKIRSTNK